MTNNKDIIKFMLEAYAEADHIGREIMEKKFPDFIKAVNHIIEKELRNLN